MDDLKRLDVDAFKQLEKLPLVVVLDSVRSLHNVGSAFRTADAFALERVVLCGITGTPPHREIEKTALGATQSVDWQYEADVLTLVQQLKEDGYTVLAVEQVGGSIPLQEYIVSSQQKYALVFGNEVHGVNEDVVRMADACIEIPQFGTKHSLNVSVSIGIVLWQFLAKCKLSKK